MSVITPIFLESPYGSESDEGVLANERYARNCIHDCLVNFDEAPFASHLLYTQPGVLDDRDPSERNRGIKAGFAWRLLAARTVVYVDLGISTGMKLGIADSRRSGIPVVFRSLVAVAGGGYRGIEVDAPI